MATEKKMVTLFLLFLILPAIALFFNPRVTTGQNSIRISWEKGFKTHGKQGVTLNLKRFEYLRSSARNDYNNISRVSNLKLSILQKKVKTFLQ